MNIAAVVRCDDSTDILTSLFANFTDSNLDSNRIWLDATDVATEGTFIWIATNDVLTYTNWRPNEPTGNFDGRHEDCLQIHDDGKWNDESCTRTWSSVCEIEYQ